MTTGDLAAPTVPKKRFEFTACGPTAKISREALQEIFLIYAAGLLTRIAVKVWSRLETRGQLTSTRNLLFAIAGAFLIALFEVIYPSLPLLLPLVERNAPWVQGVFSHTVSTIILYAVVLVILFFRPQGLFGEIVQKRA